MAAASVRARRGIFRGVLITLLIALSPSWAATQSPEPLGSPPVIAERDGRRAWGSERPQGGGRSLGDTDGRRHGSSLGENFSILGGRGVESRRRYSWSLAEGEENRKGDGDSKRTSGNGGGGGGANGIGETATGGRQQRRFDPERRYSIWGQELGGGGGGGGGSAGAGSTLKSVDAGKREIGRNERGGPEGGEQRSQAAPAPMAANGTGEGDGLARQHAVGATDDSPSSAASRDTSTHANYTTASTLHDGHGASDDPYTAALGNGSTSVPAIISDEEDNGPCRDIPKHSGYVDACSFVKARESCSTGTFVEYLQFHFCTCARFPLVSYAVMILWMMALFVMLGNTAADYFCPSLERISEILHLPPTVAGVTLLPLGNGAPDVFASIASFIGAGAGQVGLNSVLGGGMFVTAVVVGLITFAVQSLNVKLDRGSFIRDVGFYMLAIFGLFIIIFVGRVTVWGTLAFLSLYIAYAVTVASSEAFAKWARNKTPGSTEWWLLQPFTSGNLAATDPFKGGWIDFDEGDEYHTLLGGGTGQFLLEEDASVEEVRGLTMFPTPAPDDVSSRCAGNALPQWMWTAHVAIYAQKQRHADGWDYGWSNPRPLWGWMEEDSTRATESSLASAWRRLNFGFRKGLKKALAVPLIMPRRLTIPCLEEERWSRHVFITSATLAPLMFTLAVVTRTFTWEDGRTWATAILSGVVMGLLAMVATRSDTSSARFTDMGGGPPDRWAFPWVCVGFVMSIVWFYVLANELVAVLVAIGNILGIDATILGVTVLAWGNSIGDVVSNLTLAKSGGPGAQMAVSASYAGPMFNCLIGIGASLALSSWRTRPHAFVIPLGADDGKTTIFVTMAFLMGGMSFAAFTLLSNQMRLTKGLGIGLLLIYSCFITLRLLGVAGLLPILGSGHVS
ncbi:hypothetical protein CBR_g37505 [Chara braunii]|uniref:Sodium/calcium exchanger membrane region domain-containing protein n=1 Tax=Chara braunii TaxID=69332 RepID=A0A388LN39_CHABU|nr:hypothetical protein CBR_g37505 [Chara braunii]|eukprot:GBG83704.1 hypothetical protein CBR_g37505 [Chara braunii]